MNCSPVSARSRHGCKRITPNAGEFGVSQPGTSMPAGSYPSGGQPPRSAKTIDSSDGAPDDPVRNLDKQRRDFNEIGHLRT
jgi:hypothetical protein